LEQNDINHQSMLNHILHVWLNAAFVSMFVTNATVVKMQVYQNSLLSRPLIGCEVTN